MLTFRDGPASTIGSLACHHAPAVLRVVRNRITDEWDACDRPSDHPEAFEEIHVYERVEPPEKVGRVHLNMGKASGWYEIASYRHRPDVDGEQVRDQRGWLEWATGPGRLPADAARRPPAALVEEMA